MKAVLENKPQLGRGIYTIPDISLILKLPIYKVNRWIKDYWDVRFGYDFNQKYSWHDGKSKAISFHTLIELYTFYQLGEAGVNSRKIIEAHKILAKKYKTPFPFATSQILDNISTDGKRIYFEEGIEIIYSVDKTLQLNLNFISEFFKKIDFDCDELAQRLWPIGKKKSIVVDPKHQFGQPTIAGTNINAQTISIYYRGGDDINFISEIFDLKKQQVEDAIEFCQKVA